MKKLLSFSAALFFICVTVVYGQSNSNSNSNSNTDTKKETTVVSDKKCHGVSASCPHPCTGAKASTSTSETMSQNHSNAGSSETAPSCAGASADHKDGKACCKSVSKASAMTKSSKLSKATTEVAPKDESEPHQ